MIILGINYGHDAAACLIQDGHILAAVAEERFTRIKNDSSFPLNAIAFCMKSGGIGPENLDHVAFAGKSIRLNTRAFMEFPSRYRKGAESMRARLKAAIRGRFSTSLGDVQGDLPLYQNPFRLGEHCEITCVPHHFAHAASAYYTAGLGDTPALIVTMDGVGEGTSTALWRGERNRISPLVSYPSSSSIGWFYGNATEAMGWRHGSDEWKLMGLAPYGTPHPGALRGHYPEFSGGKLTHPHNYGEGGVWNDHGSMHFHLDDARKLLPLVEKLGRENFAAEVQRAVEEQMGALILPAMARENVGHLCCAGGCFLNVKANQRLWYSGKLTDQWVYPDPADAGLAVGAALAAYYERRPKEQNRRLQHLYWGPEFGDEAIEQILRDRGLVYTRPADLSGQVAGLLARNLVIGWFQGRMEAGPRALGNRSILMSPLHAENKDLINAKVKYREGFRPFCPSILAEMRDTYLRGARDEHFMISSFDVTPAKRDRIPAVVHVDGTVRPQLVKREVNPRYYDLIKAFGERTGEPVLLNTSFNVKGEPIVCNPREAIKCFFDTGLDALVLGSYLVTKPALSPC